MTQRRDVGSRADHRPTHRVPVPVDVLRERMHHQISTIGQRPVQRRRRKRRIHAQHGPGIVRDTGQLGDVGHPRRRVGDHLGVDQPGVRTQR